MTTMATTTVATTMATTNLPESGNLICQSPCCRRRRDNNGYNNGGYNNGYNNGYGRKLKQNVVANIICDALGNCDDGRGRRYYDENRDDRRYVPKQLLPELLSQNLCLCKVSIPVHTAVLVARMCGPRPAQPALNSCVETGDVQ